MEGSWGKQEFMDSGVEDQREAKSSLHCRRH